MSYDIAFRHQQALDTSALTTLLGALHDLQAAIEDTRRAGKQADSDPAVILLARHLGAIANSQGESDSTLKKQCMSEISDLRRKPVLVTLAYRGVAYDQDAKKLFHGEARRALIALADALGYERSDYDIRSNAGGPAVSGEVTLHSDELYVQISCGGFSHNGEILYRRCRDRRDFSGERNNYAGIREITNPGVFAARLCRELGLSTGMPDNRLVA